MSRISQEEINKRLDLVPQAIKDIATSSDTDGLRPIIDNVSLKYHLSEKQQDLVEDEVGLVLLGFTKARNLISELNAGGIKPDTSQQISDEMNMKVFARVRHELADIIDASSTQSTNNTDIKAAEDTLTGPTISTKLDEGTDIDKLDIDKVLKEIESAGPQKPISSDEDLKKPLGGAYTPPKPIEKRFDESTDKQNTVPVSTPPNKDKMKSVFEKKLEHFYQAPETETHVDNRKPKEQKSGPLPGFMKKDLGIKEGMIKSKTSSPPGNLPKVLPTDGDVELQILAEKKISQDSSLKQEKEPESPKTAPADEPKQQGDPYRESIE